MTATKLEALAAIIDWMGAYGGDGDKTLADAIEHDADLDAEGFPEDMVAGYRLALKQYEVERVRVVRERVRRTISKQRPELSGREITRLIQRVLDENPELLESA